MKASTSGSIGEGRIKRAYLSLLVTKYFSTHISCRIETRRRTNYGVQAGSLGLCWEVNRGKSFPVSAPATLFSLLPSSPPLPISIILAPCWCAVVPSCLVDPPHFPRPHPALCGRLDLCTPVSLRCSLMVDYPPPLPSSPRISCFVWASLCSLSFEARATRLSSPFSRC